MVAQLLATVLLAQTQVVILNGKANHPRELNTAEYAYTAARDQGWNTHVLVGQLPHWEPKWTFVTDPAHQTSIENKQQIRQRLTDVGTAGSMLLYIPDHGGQPDSRASPLSATITVYGDAKREEQRLIAEYNSKINTAPRAELRALDARIDGARARARTDYLAHSELRDTLKALPENRTIKIVGGYCYDGALHSIAFELPNVCTVSATGFRSYYEVERAADLRPFGKGFWQEVRRKDKQHDLDGDEKTSLFEAYLAAIAADVDNEHKGQTSSMAYVDQYFRIDQYARSSYVEFTNSTELNRLGRRFPALVQRIQEDQIAAPVCKLTPDRTGERSLQNIADFHQQIDRVLANTTAAELESADLPLALRGLWTRLLTAWNDGAEERTGRLDRIHADFNTAHEQWNALSNPERRRRNNEFVTIFDALEARASQELRSARYHYQLMRQMERVALFMKSAPKDKRDKFLQLLACEMEPL